ncbi:MAG: OmpA family protein [Bacteroidales bacterium]|nr:OmpA family protein [Bacteroidales bacterium]
MNRTSVGLFSKDLRTRLNDGPATFTRSGDTVYFSRNLNIEGRLSTLSGIRNKLGLFYAIYRGEKWINIREMRFNMDWFNITMPCLSHDGNRLYFASDMPNGYGGLDIYYSQLRNGYWEDPVNLGPVVNTKGNESYPFINEAGDLFFSSDGHEGLGGKDIFVTKQRSLGWYIPVRLNAPINSEFDDFGIVTDATTSQGYFSSVRGKTVDIYQFKSSLFLFWFSDPQKENQYCFSLTDTGLIKVDTLRFQYLWDFGDNSKSYGNNTDHCFPGPGRYKINLDIINRKTGRLFFRKLTYDLEIVDIDQPFIQSVDYAIIGENIEFNGLKSYCPGYDITSFYWDFGDGIQAYGERADHQYSESGKYHVRLGLTLKSQITGDIIRRAVTKQVIVFRTEQEKSAYLATKPVVKKKVIDIIKTENINIISQYSAERDFSLKKELVFLVEILSSPDSVPVNNNYFAKVPAKYTIRELFDAETRKYSYIIDQQMNLMSVYQSYSDIIASGYNNARVRLFELKDPAERGLFNLERTYGLLTDAYFDVNNRLVTNAYIMLDQVVNLMNKYPGIKLEIGVHTDNQGVPANLQSLSQLRAQVIMDYLINRGIANNRLIAKGYGSTRPLNTNSTYLDKRLNRRIDFIILN